MLSWFNNHPGISFQLCVHFTHFNVASAFDKLSHCLEDAKRWLKLNPDKAELIVFLLKVSV